MFVDVDPEARAPFYYFLKRLNLATIVDKPLIEVSRQAGGRADGRADVRVNSAFACLLSCSPHQCTTVRCVCHTAY